MSSKKSDNLLGSLNNREIKKLSKSLLQLQKLEDAELCDRIHKLELGDPIFANNLREVILHDLGILQKGLKHNRVTSIINTLRRGEDTLMDMLYMKMSRLRSAEEGDVQERRDCLEDVVGWGLIWQCLLNGGNSAKM